MNQESSSSYMNRQSYSSPSDYNPYKNQFRYSTRRYATLEESEATFPVFTTPTNMYIRTEYNPPIYPQQYNMYSTNYNPNPNQQSPFANGNHTYPHHDSSNRNEALNSGSTTAKDEMVAQLVEMGFDVAQSKLAVDATGTNNLQDALDLLVQNFSSSSSSSSNSGSHKQRTPPVPEKDATTNAYTTPPPPPPPHDPSFLKNKTPYTTPRQEHPTPPAKTTPQPSYYSPLPKRTPQQELFSPPSKKSTPQQQDYFSSSTLHTPPKSSTPPPSPSYSKKAPQESPAPKHTANATPTTNATINTTNTTATTTDAPSLPKHDASTTSANKERKQGNFSFNRGQFHASEASYTLAIKALPDGHGDLPLLLNNRAAALIKQGKYKECLRDCQLAIDIASKNTTLPITPIMKETSTTMKAQWIKALHRKACALEGLGRYQDAIRVYEASVKLDPSAQVQQGIKRCQRAMQNKTTNTKPGWVPDEINQSKAVQEMRERERKREAEEAERLQKEDQVNAQIDLWKKGKERNLRMLLSSLDLILWPGVQWKSVKANELMEPRKCKVTYMKAIAKVHPDKLPSNSTVEQRMLASGIFTILNQAWDTFKTENHL